jgi:hypothetical protein
MRLLPTEKYKIIDDAVCVEDFSAIKDLLLGANFPWFFQSAVAEYNQENLSEFYYVHTFFNADTKIASYHFKEVMPLFKNLEMVSLLRMKANMYPNIGKEIINQPHVDFPFEHVGAVFYINSNNGFTILDDGTKIESKENRLLLFRPSELHQSTHCTDQKVRVNINFNYF